MAEFTTMETLQTRASAIFGAVLKYDDRVIYTDYTFGKGHYCKVYEFIDEPGEEIDELEARLSLISQRGGFEDGGHAVEWGLSEY